MADIAQQLPHLPPDQLRALQDQISVLLAIGPKGNQVARGGRTATRLTDAGMFAMDLYEALADALRKRTQVKSAPWPVFAKSAQFSNHFEAAALAAFDANAVWFPKQSRTERASMLHLYADLILEQLERQQRELVWHNIAYALKELPAVMDAAFPGYASSGLLGLVQRLRTKGQRTPV